MTRKTAIALASVVLAFVAISIFFGESPVRDSTGSSGVEAAPSIADPKSPIPLTQPGAGPQRTPAGSVVQGTVVVQHELGGEYLDLQEGTITLRSGGMVIDIPVIDGQFSARITAGPDQDVVAIEARRAGIRLFMAPTSLHGESSDNTVRAYNYDGFFVQARNPAGEALQALRFVTRPDMTGASGSIGRVHPGNLDLCRFLAGTTSGLIFLPMLSNQSPALWVRSPGYTWRSISHQDVSVGKTLAVTLERAGSAVVRIGSFRPLKGICVLLAAGDDHGRVLATYSAIDVEEVRLDGIPPSDYVVGLSLGPVPSLGRVKSWSEVENVGAGREAEFSVNLPSDNLHSMGGGINGTLTISSPTTWEHTPVFRQVRVELYESGLLAGPSGGKGRVDLVTLQKMGAGRDVGENRYYSWNFSDIPAGLYQARLAPFGIDQAIEVKAGQLSDLTLTLPPISKTIVETVVDGQAAKSLGVSAVAHDGETSALLNAYEAETGDMIIISLPGKHDFWTRVGGRAPAQASAQLLPGLNHIAIDVPPTFNVVLRAVDPDGSELDLSWWADVRVESAGPGMGELVDHSVRRSLALGSNASSNSRGIYYLSAPGLYTFTFPELADGRGAQPLTIDVPETHADSPRDVLVD